MSPPQMFHLPTALKRTKSVVTGNQRRQHDRRDGKLHDVLGVSEADINTARNQSVSSAATTKLHSNSLSDATTETGCSPSHHARIPQIPELHLKASSVLLHEDYEQPPGTGSSIRSVRLRNYDSSSTLHSHYDAHNAPLAVSQQTSDSSRRDFALRKGKPVVISSTTPEQDSRRQLKFFKTSKSGPATVAKKQSKTRPYTGHTKPLEPAIPDDWKSMVDRPATPKSAKSTKSSIRASKLQKGVRFEPPPLPSPASNSLAVDTKTKNSLLEPMDPACVKVNIRRPKVGAKHWFDGLEGDSSEEESIDEPEFQQNFVVGIENAFQNDQIGANSSDTSTITTRQLSSTISADTDSTPRSRLFPSFPSRQPAQEPAPRMAVLDAKASNSNLVSIGQFQPQPSRNDPLASKDLTQSSVLNLSSSDDEDEDAPPAPPKMESVISSPPLRDSVKKAFNNESEIEFGMAKAVTARQTHKTVEAPRIKQLRSFNQQSSRDQLRMPIPKRGSSLMLSYLNDQHAAEEGPKDLLAFFPATPIESLAPSHRTSTRSSVTASEADSLESRRLMTVTKQEESLLAAMRLKKAAMRYHVTQDKRLEALRNLERAQSRLSEQKPVAKQKLQSASHISLDTQPPFESARTSQQQYRRSFSGDDTGRSRASGTTFQTMTSRNPSRMSKLTFQTDISSDPQNTRLSLSSSDDSEHQSTAPSLLSLSTAERRRSRDTYFSTSSAGYAGGHSRTLTINSHVVALDDLDKVQPKRADIPSQEFIDWPYKGWEARVELALAR